METAFSILYRIVGSVTRKRRCGARDGEGFQYPLSDRGQCNTMSTTVTAMTGISFSILYRIVGSVTQRGVNMARVSFEGFQYPLSDRGQCNRILWIQDGVMNVDLSVSSIGSWAV